MPPSQVANAPEINQIDSVPIPNAKLHLKYLDGLRGLSALYVVLSHVRAELISRPDLSHIPRSILYFLQLFSQGHLAVVIFIVLSGYCLMMPVARSKEKMLRGGMKGFMLRRAKRILPPYYAALAYSLGVVLLEQPWRRSFHTHWTDVTMNCLHLGPLLSHFFLVHNLTWQWSYTINGPLWSVATEWQIYFVFPLVLLPVWRRFGIGTALATGIILGELPHFALHHRFDEANFQFLGLFAMGMAAAAINFNSENNKPFMSCMHWGKVSLAFFVLATAGILPHLQKLSLHGLLTDILYGAAAACALVSFTNNLSGIIKKPQPFILRVLNSQWAVALGAFSYSIYLIHYPILGSINLLLLNLHVSPVPSLGIMTLIGMPLILLFGYGFHLLFERPFMNIR